MKNFVQQGENVTLAAPYDVASGAGAKVGSIFGVAQHDAEEAADVVLARRGVYDLAKTSAQAWTVGAKVYWDDTNKVCTTVASGNTLIGAAMEVAADPSATGRVLLDGTAR
ncbi:DUF2190 family protein [Pseudooceanicola atlanticus]|uniref:DUF2190 family protein n=1 Tax=Pseudooceanicola atlanticus TaxID=1461694 RepID=UPI002356CA6D|nr:DUF2190 family protein [Pseudooceanicola atlanticus]